MRYILCQPATKRFKWELEVFLTRLRNLYVKMDAVILLFSEHDPEMPEYFKTMGCQVHVYPDDRDRKRYIPSIKPYLWTRYLEEDRSREIGEYFYTDSDVIFRDIPLVKPDRAVWYASNCNSYLGVEYIDSKGEGLLKKMCMVIGVDEAEIRGRSPNVGAQWVIKDPSVEYWRKVYNDSNRLYQYLLSIEGAYVNANSMMPGYKPIQKWTAEMWAQLWNVYLFDRDAREHDELQFVFATDTAENYNKVKILHNAGVIDGGQGLFFKGAYGNRSPFDDDLSFVSEGTASYEYVRAILEAKTLLKNSPG